MPRGLAVASAVTLRVVIVVGGIVLLGLFAKRMMVVVLPVIIALLLATLLAPLATWLRSQQVPSGAPPPSPRCSSPSWSSSGCGGS